MSITDDITAYKLYTIKSKDDVLYSDLVKIMNTKSHLVQKKLLKKVRELQDMDNSVIAIHKRK